VEELIVEEHGYLEIPFLIIYKYFCFKPYFENILSSALVLQSATCKVSELDADESSTPIFLDKAYVNFRETSIYISYFDNVNTNVSANPKST